ncbi:MAG: hypothetical protein P9L99_13045 [Candidatus Lernaella stagnicola]|nr:hypothetical protein [Candidatus Lernaella stagnicola]
MRKPHIGLVIIGHPNEVGFDLAGSCRDQAAAVLATLPITNSLIPHVISDIAAADAAGEVLRAADIDGLVVLTATWSDDFLALRLVERLSVPVFTWALRGVETGSLCGTQQLDMVLAELGRPYRFWFGEIADPETAAALADFAFAAALAAAMRRLRIGLLGHRTFGMTEIAVDEIGLRRRLGPEVVPLSMRRFVTAVDQAPLAEATKAWRQAQAAANVEVDDETGLYAGRVLATLRAWMAEHRLGAVAVDCYPDFMGRFCLAASQLAGEDLVVACEGDVNGAVAQVAAHFLTGGPTHNTDLLDVDVAEGTALFSHCGCGHPSLAESPAEIRLAPVRLADEGLCVLFPGKPGPVTLLNLVGGGDSYRLGVLEGEAVRTDMVFPGNPTKVRLPGGGREFLDFVARHALGHHWMIGYGHVGRRARWWAELCGLNIKSYGGDL